MQKNGYFVRTKTPLLLSRNKSKLLSFALRRIVLNLLGSTMQQLRKYSQSVQKKIIKIQRVYTKNLEIDIIKAWQRMKMYAIKSKSKDRIIKDIFVLVKRFEKSMLKDAFCKLQNNVSMSNSVAVEKAQRSRKILLGQCLKKLYINTKKYSWNKLKFNVAQMKIKKRLMIVNILFKGAQKRNILYAWASIKSCKGKNTKLLTQKIDDLSLQLQDMKIQVQNKNQNISRLQQQITQLKHSSTLRYGQGNSMLFNNSYGNRSGSQINRSRSRNNNSFDRDKDSNDGSVMRDTSFGSLLGGISILSYRSRGSNAGSKVEECACTVCNYRQKYEKYRATNQTLKKQLDIIKTQLEFTKDMNQHMENQIRSQVSTSDQERKMQKLRQQLKQSHKDRQILRDKVLKYEKYVVKLKLQFKTKIEQIYRKVKKGT